MRRLLFLTALLCLPLLCQAGDEEDTLKTLDDCSAHVSALSAIHSPSFSNFDAVEGELNSLPPFFDRVRTALTRLNIGPGAQLVDVGASVQARVLQAGKYTTLNVSALIDACHGVQGDLDRWQSLLPDVRKAIQSRIDARTGAMIQQQVSQILPTAVAGPGAGPGIGLPSPTPVQVVGPTTPNVTPTPLVPPAVPMTPVPVAAGGVIPGGWVPAPPPSSAFTPVPGLPTLQPTPQAQLRAPVAIAVGHNGQRVWVANVHSNSVGVMDASTQRFVNDIPVGSQPQALGLDDGDNTLVVANFASSSVTLVDGRQDTVIKTLNVGAGPMEVLVIHGHKAYVLCQDGHSVAVIDLNLHLLLKSIALSSRPGRMEQPNSSAQVYVTLPDEDAVAVIDPSYDDVAATIRE